MLSLAAAALMLLAAACSSGEPTPTSVPAATPAAAEAPAPTPTPTATAEATPTDLPDALFLSVTAPEDESTTSDVVTTVAGETTPDAVVSINGEPVDVDVLGQFAALVELIEGPNLIEVVASNLTEQRQVEIVVISLP